ncbi:MAG: nitrous oxide reductase family maturation protein NosD [Planctomycetota bacterium]
MSMWFGCLALLLAACAEKEPRVAVEPARLAPPEGTSVPAGSNLDAWIARSPDGSALLLEPGIYSGPVTIDKPIAVWGPADAVIETSGVGSTVSLTARGARLLGCTVKGSGGRFDLLDSGIRVRADDVTVSGVTVREALFGILVESCSGVTLRANRVIGKGGPALGLRGDAIRLWETTDSEVLENAVEDSRDIVVWYSSRNRVAENRVIAGRYGTHFMYSHDCLLEGNSYVGNVVGCFVMYCHGVVLCRNVLAESGGAAGMGIGMKESGDVTVEENWIVGDATGIYVDSSPLDVDQRNRYARNVFALCGTAVAFHSSPHRSEFADNSFRGNECILTVGGDGDALDVRWVGNHYDAYAGYDLDSDGFGDVPFEFRRLSAQIEGKFPALALFHGAPSMQLVDAAAELMPLFSPRSLMMDRKPRMAPADPDPPPGASRAR